MPAAPDTEVAAAAQLLSIRPDKGQPVPLTGGNQRRDVRWACWDGLARRHTLADFGEEPFHLSTRGEDEHRLAGLVAHGFVGVRGTARNVDGVSRHCSDRVQIAPLLP
jgi:hypothetical protein